MDRACIVIVHFTYLSVKLFPELCCPFLLDNEIEICDSNAKGSGNTV